MHMSKLPDDCLILIFKHFHFLEDLISLSQVCSDWRRLISYRLENTKYLLKYHSFINPKIIYLKKYAPQLELRFNEFLPNLKIMELHFSVPLDYCQSPNQLIKGLVYPTYYKRSFIADHEHYRGQAFASFFPNVEMITFFGKMDPYFKTSPQGSKLKQIYIDDSKFNSMAKYAENLPNLQRLHVDSIYFNDSAAYSGPVFPRLKILEIRTLSSAAFYAFFNLDFCPSLQSAYFCGIGSNYSNFPVKINENLRDLVIDNTKPESHYSQTCQYLTEVDLRNLLLKFPNLENLALRGNAEIKDEHMQMFVENGLKLKLLDFRGSPGVTSMAVCHLDSYCRRKGRSPIVIYYDCTKEEEPEDWPPIEKKFEQIVQGFDFMKHCFFKTFESLPYMMESNDPVSLETDFSDLIIN